MGWVHAQQAGGRGVRLMDHADRIGDQIPIGGERKQGVILLALGLDRLLGRVAFGEGLLQLGILETGLFQRLLDREQGGVLVRHVSLQGGEALPQHGPLVVAWETIWGAAFRHALLLQPAATWRAMADSGRPEETLPQHAAGRPRSMSLHKGLHQKRTRTAGRTPQAATRHCASLQRLRASRLGHASTARRRFRCDTLLGITPIIPTPGTSRLCLLMRLFSIALSDVICTMEFARGCVSSLRLCA